MVVVVVVAVGAAMVSAGVGTCRTALRACRCDVAPVARKLFVDGNQTMHKQEALASTTTRRVLVGHNP